MKPKKSHPKPKPKPPEAERLAYLLSLDLDLKRGACLYEALRRFRASGGKVSEWSVFSAHAFSLEKGLGDTPITKLPHWLELDPALKQFTVLAASYEHSVRLEEVWGAEDRKRVSEELSDTREMWAGESVIAVRVRWPLGLSAILKDFESILQLRSPLPTPGARENLDDRSARGKRTGSGELDPALESLEALALLEQGLPVMEVARRLEIDRRKVQRATQRVGDLLQDWFQRRA